MIEAEVYKKQRKNIKYVYLHVIEYNKSAIGFYLGNGFIIAGQALNYYELDDKTYAGILLC